MSAALPVAVATTLPDQAREALREGFRKLKTHALDPDNVQYVKSWEERTEAERAHTAIPGAILEIRKKICNLNAVKMMLKEGPIRVFHDAVNQTFIFLGREKEQLGLGPVVSQMTYDAIGNQWEQTHFFRKSSATDIISGLARIVITHPNGPSRRIEYSTNGFASADQVTQVVRLTPLAQTLQEILTGTDSAPIAAAVGVALPFVPRELTQIVGDHAKEENLLAGIEDLEANAAAAAPAGKK